MKIAMLISGRAARYEACLLPILKESKHEIHVFMSINDEPCEYYENLQKDMFEYLKGFEISKFQLPEFSFNYAHNQSLHFHHKNINGRLVPFNQFSMYYNDKNAFNMACNYEEQNNIKYDLFMKFRSDICNTRIPDDLCLVPEDDLKIFSVVPLCNMTALAKHHVPIVSDAWVWTNKKTMQIYCNTYNYVLEQLSILDGKYLVHYESGPTDNLYDNNVQIQYVNIHYNLDRNRRIFEMHTYLGPIDQSKPPIDIKTVSKLNLPADPFW